MATAPNQVRTYTGAEIETLILKVAPAANKALVKKLAPFIASGAKMYSVNTPLRMASFLGQAALETDGFKVLQEYASGAAYEGRLDLGNTQKGDGTKFKGRGIFMYTGRANYASVSKTIFGDTRLLTTPALLEQPEYAVKSAFIYWSTRTYNKLPLNTYADRSDTLSISKAINGVNKKTGMPNHASERETYTKKALAFLLSFSPPVVGAFFFSNLLNIFKRKN